MPLSELGSIARQALQQYFLKGGTTQFLSSWSRAKSSQYCVPSLAGQCVSSRSGGGQWRNLQRRRCSRGFGPHSLSSDAGHTSGRCEIPRPHVAEHWNLELKYIVLVKSSMLFFSALVSIQEFDQMSIANLCKVLRISALV